MFNIQNLFNRKTIKNFISKKIPDDVIQTALKIAYKTPTAYNARPSIVYDITKHKNVEWLSHQQSIKTADRIFLFCFNPKEAEMNIRKFISKRMWVDLFSEPVNAVIARWIWLDPMNFCKYQIYISAGYFTSVLEAEWITWCYIVWYDKDICKSELNLPEDVFPELIFACWYKDESNPWSYDTDFVRSFDEFYKGDI